MLTFPNFDNRCGVPAHIRMNAIPCERGNLPDVPVIFVAGTCMNSGKTSAACRLVRQLAMRGKAVGACKLTGVSLRRDTLQMTDYGAKWAVSFTDAGIVSTSAETAVTVAHGLVRHLAQAGAEVIVAELGRRHSRRLRRGAHPGRPRTDGAVGRDRHVRQRPRGGMGGQASDGPTIRTRDRRGERPDHRQPRRHAVRQGRTWAGGDQRPHARPGAGRFRGRPARRPREVRA